MAFGFPISDFRELRKASPARYPPFQKAQVRNRAGLRIRMFGGCAMSHGKRPFTDAQLDCAIKVVHKHGYVVTGLRRHADGFTIMTSKPGEAGVTEKLPNEWDEIFDGEDHSEAR